MKFKEIAEAISGIPYTQKERGKQLYHHMLKHKPRRCLERGFAHGVASCYMAAALDEIGSGELACVDLNSSKTLQPNLEDLLAKTSTWFLQKEISRNSHEYC